MTKRVKRLKLKRVVAMFDDGSQATWKIDQGSWSLDVRRDIDSSGNASTGWVEHVGLPSGKVVINAAFTSSSYEAGPSKPATKRRRSAR